MLQEIEQPEADRVPGRSLPAVVSRMNITPNSCSDNLDPSSSASTSLVVMSSRGSPRRARRARGRTRSGRARTGSRRGAAELGILQRPLGDVLLPHHLGVGVAEDLVAGSMISRLSSTGKPMISENTHIGISAATDSTQSNSSCSNALVRIPQRELPDTLLVRVDDAWREALVDERPHPRVRRGIGVDHRLPRLELLLRRVHNEVPPSSDENVCQSFDTWTMSSYRVSTQNPRPSRSGCQWSGASRRRSASQS